MNYDEDGMLRAPYNALADIFDVKSVSSVKSRLDVLSEAGIIEIIGSGRNIKYKILENA